MQPARGLPLLLTCGMEVALTPPALTRDRFCTVEEVADDGATARVRFSGIDSIDAAEGITGCHVLARRDDLDLGPLMASVDELIGRAVNDARYGALGCIQSVWETPANDVWVVDGERWGEVLIPVIAEVVPEIPETGPIAVAVMDGLIDAPAPDAGHAAYRASEAGSDPCA